MNQTVFSNSHFVIEETPFKGLVVKDRTPEAVVIIALSENRLVAVRQFREPVQTWTIELPGGAVEQGENKVDAAQRELREETGYICGKLHHLGEYNSHACLVNRRVHAFFSDELIKRGETEFDEDEDLTVLYFTLEEAVANIRSGEWKDSEMVHALLLAHLKGHLHLPL